MLAPFRLHLVAHALALLPAHALGIVSRSCGPVGAQESVTVDWHFRPHYLKTFSIHYRNGGFLHTASSADDGGAQWRLGWRSYAGHFGSEFWHGKVIGQHYAYRSGVISYLGNSYASNCNLREWG